MQHYGTPIIDLNKPWDAEELRPLMLHTWRNGPYYELDVPLRPFFGLRCPSAAEQFHSDGQPFATYVGNGGVGDDAPLLTVEHKRAGAWGCDRQTSFADVVDGTIGTLFLVETDQENGCWIAGGKATVRGVDCELTSLPFVRGVGSAGQFGGLHPGGAMAVFMDGHVDFVRDDTEPDVFTSMCTISASNSSEKGQDANTGGRSLGLPSP